MNFWPNSKFWKENDCPDSMSPRGDAILLMTGSFNPIHRAHIHSMEAARISVEKSGYRVICGYLSPSHDSYVQSKIKKVIKKKEKKKGGSTGKGGCFSFNNKQRLSLASLSIEDNDWIDIGTWETMGSHDSWPDYPEVCSHLANHLKEKARFFNNDQNKDQNTTAATESEQKLTLFYVCGMDHYIKCDPSTALGYEITNCKPIQLGVVVVDRNDTTMINSSTGGGGGGVSGGGGGSINTNHQKKIQQRASSSPTIPYQGNHSRTCVIGTTTMKDMDVSSTMVRELLIEITELKLNATVSTNINPLKNNHNQARQQVEENNDGDNRFGGEIVEQKISLLRELLPNDKVTQYLMKLCLYGEEEEEDVEKTIEVEQTGAQSISNNQYNLMGYLRRENALRLDSTSTQTSFGFIGTSQTIDPTTLSQNCYHKYNSIKRNKKDIQTTSSSSPSYITVTAVEDQTEKEIKDTYKTDKTTINKDEEEEEESQQQQQDFIPGLIYLQNFITEKEEDRIRNEIANGPWDNDNSNRRTRQFGYGFHWRNRSKNVLKKLSNSPLDAISLDASRDIIHRLEQLILAPNSNSSSSSPSCESASSSSSLSSTSLPTHSHFNFEQCIVNDYSGGQGIRPHIDRKCFGEYIVGFSIGYDTTTTMKEQQQQQQQNEIDRSVRRELHPSSVVMDFTNIKTKEIKAILLEPRSIMVITKEARYEWRHSINAEQCHIFRGQLINRKNARRTSLTFRTIEDKTVISASSSDNE